MKVRPMLAAVAVALVGLPAGSAAAGPGVDVIAQRGFGDRDNSYAWSMAWFKGRLYVGTARQEACLEMATVDYYLPQLELYSTNPYPHVRCPRDRYDMDLRAEIWQYTPWTRSWRRVFRSPLSVPNPRARGKRVARDIAFRGMVVHRDGRGRQMLYVAGLTAGEYLPEIKRRNAPRILRTVDGRHFRPLVARDVVVRAFNGNHRPIGFRSLRVWRDRLYVTATPGLTGDGAVFEVRRPWSGRPRFRQVTPRAMRVFEITTFDGALYAGTGDNVNGYSVFKTRSGRRWKAIVTGGAGRGRSLTSVVTMHAFRGHLYVGSSGWYNFDQLPVSELIRISPEDRWSIVVGNPRVVDGIVKEPISGLYDGFENLFNAHFWRMAQHRGALYLGTNDWSYMIQVDKRYPVLQSLLAAEFGFDVWASCDGRDWFPVTRDAFGGTMYDFGARTFVPSRAGLFIGSTNHALGTTVWRDRAPACSSLMSRRSGAPPRGLAAAVRRHRTVLSWRRSPGAARYRVQRSDYRFTPLNVAAPPALPDGMRLEGQAPILVAPGTPGSTQIDVPLPTGFRTVGTTDGQLFVDRTADPNDRHAYQVVAETASGAVSAPSNVEVVGSGAP